MLRKILGTIIGLVLAAFGVALLGGWLDPAELDDGSGGRRSRSMKQLIGWLCETLGAAGAGAVVIAAGAFVVFLALRKPRGEEQA